MSSTRTLIISAPLRDEIFSLRDEFLSAEKRMEVPELNDRLDKLFPEEGERAIFPKEARAEIRWLCARWIELMEEAVRENEEQPPVSTTNYHQLLATTNQVIFQFPPEIVVQRAQEDMQGLKAKMPEASKSKACDTGKAKGKQKAEEQIKLPMPQAGRKRQSEPTRRTERTKKRAKQQAARREGRLTFACPTRAC
jgi:hypothetical protein